MEIFHRRIDEEKERLGITSDPSGHPPATYITIHRARILEDGYIQLSLLTATALKGTIRVKFINVQVHTYEHRTYIHTSVHMYVGMYVCQIYLLVIMQSSVLSYIV